ncbi:hypothetical protein CTU88_35250 [Streptomyces sp. JV178]|nr:hypothetical protein CTU88_35250 [Streptomyces sp. JV178]
MLKAAEAGRGQEEARQGGCRITGHSARRTLVTLGIKNGKRVDKLRLQGGWSAKTPMFWEYVDEGAMSEGASTHGIGL